MQNIYPVHIIPALSEPDWNHIPRAEITSYRWTNAVPYQACGQLVCRTDGTFLCRMSCREANPTVRYFRDEEPVYLDSALEFFLSFPKHGYLNLETNAAGTRLQEFGRERAGRVSVFSVFPEGFRAVQERTGEWWHISLTLPFAKLQRFFPDLKTESLRPGFRFSGNFYKTGSVPEHYGMWREIVSDTPDFHRPEQFGSFILV